MANNGIASRQNTYNIVGKLILHFHIGETNRWWFVLRYSHKLNQYSILYAKQMS